MIDNPPTPSRTLFIVSAAAKVVLWLVAAVWLSFGLFWGVLHFVIVPRIDTLRPWIEEQASQRVGIVVRIGNVEAVSNGLIPSIAFHGVELIDKDGRVALTLPTISAAISPRSLAAGNLEQLYVEGASLDIRRASDRSIWIAGLQLSHLDNAPDAASDWLFSQPEVAIRHGQLRWTDETRNAAPLELSDVDIVLRNRHFSHKVRLDANPPNHWGERFTVQGNFSEPVLSMHSGQIKNWSGQVFAQFGQVDWGQLRNYMDMETQVSHGRGSVRAWVDVVRGNWTGGTADVLVSDVHLGQGSDSASMVLSSASGRLAARTIDGGMEYVSEDLQFVTADGLRWPGGNARLSLWDAQVAKGARIDAPPARGELNAERLDLAALSQIAQRFPIDAKLRAALESMQPMGVVQGFQAGWTGSAHEPATFHVKGRIKQAGLATQADGMPGFRGMDLELDINERGGRAQISMNKGTLDLGKHWSEPLLPMQQLSAELQWKKSSSNWTVSANKVRLSNPDMQGELQGQWTLATNAPGPGSVDLQGQFSRIELARVQRYVPVDMSKEVRDYLKEAVRGGTATDVKLKLKGDLHDFPFAQSRQGEFRIAGNVSNGQYAYVPPTPATAGKMPWPVFTQLAGELVIDQRALSLNGMRGLWGTVPLVRGDALINNLYTNGARTVSVNTQGRGPLADALVVVNNSPLAEMTGQALAKATANGIADYRVKLDFPLADTTRMSVNGSVTLQGNDVQISPNTPRVARARGPINFTEYGYTVNGVSGRLFGGDVRIDGSLGNLGSNTESAGTAPKTADNSASVKASPAVLRLDGRVTAEGLREVSELGGLTSLAHYANGAANYQASIFMRAGVADITVNSNLTGMALNLPVPLSKTVDSALALRLQTSAPLDTTSAAIAKTQDQWQVSLGSVANLNLLRDLSGSAPRVLRGTLALGNGAGEPMAMPALGISARMALDNVDVDSWSALFSGVSSSNSRKKVTTPQFDLGADFLTTALQLRARDISWSGHTLHAVNLKATRAGNLWRGQVEATEFSGQMEYRQAGLGASASDSANAGRLYARLSRLTLNSGAAQEVDKLLDEQPASIPALDIVAEEFELQGKKLGRLEVEAINQLAPAARDTQREWLLKRLSVTMPEAVLNASGSWRLQAPAPSAQANVPAESMRDRRRTNLDFKLDIKDSGDLLTRYGMKNVIRRGKGKIEGQIGWQGSPITLDYPSMSGSFNVAIEDGQFLKSEPSIAKLLGVLSLQSLPRRLMLDFRDVFSEGFLFDFVRGDVNISQGQARTNNLQMKGPHAVVLMEGTADIARETQGIKVVVIPEFNAAGAALVYTAVNPVVGIYSLLAQWLLLKPLVQANTHEFYVDGTWLEPRVTKVERSTTAK
jgi:uncharacterized protein (TIGR02099 family)